MTGESSARRVGPRWAQRVLYAVFLALGANLAVLFFAQLPELHAQGLLVSPRRVVFEGRTRSAQVFLVNTGTERTTFRVSFKNMRMLEDGSYEDIEVPRPGERFADKIIRFAPRQVMLEPGERQIVRMLVRKPRDLAAGEYRSHLRLSALPLEGGGMDIEAAVLKPGEVHIRITMSVAVTIPVIVRHGELFATVTLSEVVLEANNPDGPPILSVRLNRSGDRSAYGDVAVTLTPNGGGETEVGLIRGIAVFVPNEIRTVRVSLSIPEGVTLEGGRLHVVYRARVEEGGTVLAEAQLRVP